MKLFRRPGAMSNSILLKLLIVGDTRLYCDGVAHLLRLDKRFLVLSVAYTASEALDQLARASCMPHIALVDIGMNQGCQVIHSIVRGHPCVQVVALGVNESDEDIIVCAEAGAAGYVSRSARVEELVAVLESTYKRELRCSPRVAATLFKRVAELAAGTGTKLVDMGILTQREREIADLIALRMSNKQIARRLGIEANTVKNHVHNVLEKLHLRRRQEINLPARQPPFPLDHRGTAV